MVNCSFKKNVSPNNQGVENWQLTISAWGLIKAMESKISFIFRTVSKLFWLRESMKDKNYFITGLMHSCTKNLLQTWFILKIWSAICFIMTHEPWTGIAYDCLLQRFSMICEMILPCWSCVSTCLCSWISLCFEPRFGKMSSLQGWEWEF